MSGTAQTRAQYRVVGIDCADDATDWRWRCARDVGLDGSLVTQMQQAFRRFAT